MKFVQTEKAYKIVRDIHNQGNEVYFVGGGVRDLILNQRLSSKEKVSTRDLDIATSLIPRKIQNVIKSYIEEESFSSKNLFLINVDGIDISQFKRENPDYYNGKSDKKYLGSFSVIDDAKLRDFTINSIYLTLDGKLLDFFGGQRDIQQKVLKTVIEPNESFTKDPFRILRMYYLKLKLNFSVERKTYEASIKNKGLLENLNKYQLRLLVSKLITSNILDAFIEELRKEDLLEVVFPQIKDTYNSNKVLYNRILKSISKLQKKRYDEIFIFALFFALFDRDNVQEEMNFFGLKRENRAFINLFLTMVNKEDPFKNKMNLEEAILCSKDKKYFIDKIERMETTLSLIKETLWKSNLYDFKKDIQSFKDNELSNISENLFGVFNNFILKIPNSTIQSEKINSTKDILSFYLHSQEQGLNTLSDTERAFYKYFKITKNPLNITLEKAIELGVSKDKTLDFFVELNIKNANNYKRVKEIANSFK